MYAIVRSVVRYFTIIFARVVDLTQGVHGRVLYDDLIDPDSCGGSFVRCRREGSILRNVGGLTNGSWLLTLLSK